MARSKKLRVVPLGGLDEIGKNMAVIEWGNDALIIDAGIMFPANDMLGVDYIIPDFRYLIDHKDLNIHGILFTHGHEDHIGAVAHVVEALPGIPLYGTPLTTALVEVKLRDARMLDKTTINTFTAGDALQVGPFKVESFHQCHSIPDCVGYAINTPQGLIVHTGDYKFDNTPIDGKKPAYAKLAEFSRRGVLLLMGDSTNAEQPGWTPSETLVTGAFDEVFRNAKGRIIIASFASHISRIQQVANFAKQYRRKLVIAGHSMTENVKTTRRMGILDIDDDLLIDLSKANSIPPHQVVIMATGSQGEPSAVLSRISQGQHRQLDVMEGDTIVLSAHTIPGNEESVSRTINKLFQRGANVIYDPIMPVHVSGHARQEEMKLLLNLLNPRFFLPVHGELRHMMANSRLAVSQGIPQKNTVVVENGMVVEVTKKSIRVGERVPGGYVFVDGSGVGDVGRAVIRDREILARDGFVMVVVNVDGKSGKLIGEPEIISRGFIYLRSADDLIAQMKKTVNEVMGRTRQGRNGKQREALQESLGKMLYNETKRRPMIFSVINEN